MEFLYPGFLYALAALAIPVIIHLFNFRRFKKTAFTNVGFLREIKTKTRSHNRLRHLLVLVTRLLALAALVFAFAQPYLPTAEDTGKDRARVVSVFVDNSFSMEGQTEEGNLLDVAKNRAIDIAMAYEPTDRFQLLTQDFEGRHNHLISRSEFVDYVQQVDYSPRSRTFEEIMERQDDLMKQADVSAARNRYIVSDFQKSRYDLDLSDFDTLSTLGLVYLQRNSPANLYIDSVWFANPVRKTGAAEKLNVRVTNTGPNRVENVPLELSINGQKRALASIAVSGNASADTVMHFVHDDPGLKSVTIGLEDYPVTYDDNYHIGYRVFASIDILSIRPNGTTETDYLRSVFAGDSAYRYASVALNTLDYATLPSRDLVVLDGLNVVPGGLGAKLNELLNNGGSVWVIPDDNIDLASYNAFLTSVNAGGYTTRVEGAGEVNRINTESDIYSGIFERVPRNPELPMANGHYRVSDPPGNVGEPLLTLRGGDSFLSAYPYGRGKVYLLSVSLDPSVSNFAHHGLFVATALRIAEMSRTTAVYAFDLGENQSFSLPLAVAGNEPVFHLVSTDGKTDVIPYHQTTRGQTSISPGPELQTAGNYMLIADRDTLATLGLNYNRAESRLEAYTSEELEAFANRVPAAKLEVLNGNTERLTSEVAQSRTGVELWKYCLILTLVFLLAESILLRFGKTQGE